MALERQCGVTERNLAMLDALSAPAREEMYHVPSAGPQVTRKVFVEPIERLLLDGAADGTLTATDAEETATLVFNMIGHTYRHLRTDHGWSAERARTAVVRLAIEGLIARGTLY